MEILKTTFTIIKINDYSKEEIKKHLIFLNKLFYY